jgi:hypothetical protein
MSWIAPCQERFARFARDLSRTGADFEKSSANRESLRRDRRRAGGKCDARKPDFGNLTPTGC